MNARDAKYKDFALVREMLETPEIVANFDFRRPPAWPTRSSVPASSS